MTLEESIIAKVQADTGIGTLIGTGSSARVFMSEAPLATQPPFLVVIGVSSNPEYSHDGWSAMDTARFQMDCWAATPADATALGKAVRLAFESFVGSMAGGVEVDSVFVENLALDTFNSDLQLHRYRLDLVIEAHP